MKWLRQGADKTPAACAAFSRALRRLEGRGLIVRTNVTSGMPSGHRKRCIHLLASEPHGKRTDLHPFMSLLVLDCPRLSIQELTGDGRD
jgi:hypothetical protein